MKLTIRKKAVIFLTAATAVFGVGVPVCAEDVISTGISIDGMDVSGMNYSDAKQLVMQKVGEKLSQPITVHVGEDTIEATAVDLGLQWSNQNVVTEALEMGNSGNAVKRFKETKDLGREPQELPVTFTASESRVREFVENDCKQFEKEPQDASITSDGGGGFILTEGVTGQVLNVEESIKLLDEYVANGGLDSTEGVTLAVEMEKPKGNMEDLEQIQDCLGTFTTTYGGAYGRNVNVERGAELINDHVVWPGETFSVCDHLVPFSAENGYELGGAYSNGQVVQEFGGGICQVSTTLYNALLLAEIEIVERSNHTMSVGYVPTSMDAAIAEGNMDLVFRNNLDTPIFISGYGYGGELTFSVWGKETRPADRYVNYWSETLSSTPAPTIATIIPKADQPAGYIYQAQAAMGGSSAVLYKDVTYNGETTTEQVNSSTYQTAQAIWEVGTAGASNALLNAIGTGSIEAVQAAIAGGATEKETEKETETDAPQTDAPQTDAPWVDPNVPTDPSAGGGSFIDTPDGEIYVEGENGVTVWE